MSEDEKGPWTDNDAAPAAEEKGPWTDSYAAPAATAAPPKPLVQVHPTDSEGTPIRSNYTEAMREGGHNLMTGEKNAALGLFGLPAALYAGIKNPLGATGVALGGAVHTAEQIPQAYQAVKDIWNSPGGVNHLLGLTGKTAGESGPSLLTIPLLEGLRATRLGQAVTGGLEDMPVVRGIIKAWRGPEPPIIKPGGAPDVTASTNVPYAGEDFGPVGAPVERALVPPGGAPAYAGEDFGPVGEKSVPGEAGPKPSGDVIHAPEPTRTPIGGPKTAFSLVKGAPMRAATAQGLEGAADIQGVRTGKPVIYTPKEGAGYEGSVRSREPISEGPVHPAKSSGDNIIHTDAEPASSVEQRSGERRNPEVKGEEPAGSPERRLGERRSIAPDTRGMSPSAVDSLLKKGFHSPFHDLEGSMDTANKGISDLFRTLK